MPAARSRCAACEHGVGLADAGRIAEEDPQLAALRARLLLLHASQQFIGIGALVVHLCRAAIRVEDVSS